MVVMQDSSSRNLRPSETLRKTFEWRFSVTDWIGGGAIAWLFHRLEQLSWPMAFAVVFLMAGILSLMLPTLWSWLSRYRYGQPSSVQPDLGQFLTGCVMLIGFVVLWANYREDMNRMVNLTFSATNRTYTVLAVVAAVCCAVFAYLAVANRIAIQPPTAEGTDSRTTDGGHGPDLAQQQLDETARANRAEATVGRLQKELDDAHTDSDQMGDQWALVVKESDRLANRLRALEQAEVSYVSQARDCINEDATPGWKALSSAIAVIENRMKFPVKSEEELESWLVSLSQERQVIARMGSLWGVSIALEASAPPSRQLKQFRAFNDAHNVVLNDLDYQIELWRGHRLVEEQGAMAQKRERLEQLNDSNNKLSAERDEARHQVRVTQEQLLAYQAFAEGAARNTDNVLDLKKSVLELWIRLFQRLFDQEVKTEESKSLWVETYNRYRREAVRSITASLGVEFSEKALNWMDTMNDPPEIQHFANAFNEDHNRRKNEMLIWLNNLRSELGRLNSPKYGEGELDRE